MKVRLSSQCESPDFRTQINPQELATWLSEVPDDANLIPILGDRGSQRDPEPFLRGMKAVWMEDR